MNGANPVSSSPVQMIVYHPLKPTFRKSIWVDCDCSAVEHAMRFDLDYYVDDNIVDRWVDISFASNYLWYQDPESCRGYGKFKAFRRRLEYKWDRLKAGVNIALGRPVDNLHPSILISFDGAADMCKAVLKGIDEVREAYSRWSGKPGRPVSLQEAIELAQEGARKADERWRQAAKADIQEAKSE